MNQSAPAVSVSRPSPLRRARQLLALDRQDIVVIVIYGVALGLLSLAVPIAVQSLVNIVAFGSLTQPLFVLTVLLAVALTAAAILRAVQVRIAEMLQRRLFVRIVTEIGARLPRVSAGALRHANGPELLNRFFDVFTIQKSVASLLLGGLDAVLIALVGLILLALYHPWLLAFDLVLIVGAVLVLIPLGRGGTGTSVAESKAKYSVAGWLEEMARHSLSFKLAGGGPFAQEQLKILAQSYLEKRDGHFRIVFRQVVGALTMEVVASVALLGIGGLLVIERQLSMGQLVAAELIVTAVVTTIAKLGSKVETFYDLVAGVDKVGEILDLPLERADGEGLDPRPGAAGQLVLRDVELEGGSKPMHISLQLQRGERLCIAGAPEHTTTKIGDVVFGLSPASSGIIEIDGHDARDLALREVRKRIALVRGTEIFPGCILDNLRAANAELSAEKAWEALRRVGLEEAVKDLPEGLQTRVLSDGAPLSRIQAIALTIARGVASEPSVLILDRTLDQLDPREAARVLDQLCAQRDMSLLLISEHPAVHRRVDRHVSLADTTTREGETP